MDRVLEFVKRHKVFFVVFLTGSLFSIPLFVVKFLPFMDLPQHLAAISTIYHYSDPIRGYSKYFIIDFSNTQYLFYYFLVMAFMPLFSLEVSAKIAISIYFFLFLYSIYKFFETWKEDKSFLLFFLAAPITYNLFLFMGFMNFIFSLPFYFLAIAEFKKFFETPTFKKLIYLTFLSLCIFYTHLQTYLIYLGSIAYLSLFKIKEFKRVLKFSSHIIPSFFLFVIWIFKSLIFATGEAWKKGNLGRNMSPDRMNWEPLIVSLKEIPERLFNFYTFNVDEIFLVLFILTFLVLLIFSTGKEDKIKWNIPIKILGVFMVILYFAVPVSFKWIWPINWRLLPFVVIFLILLINPLIKIRKYVIPFLILLNIFWAGLHINRFKAFNKEMYGFSDILSATEPGKRLMALIFDNGSSVINSAIFLHLGQYYQAYVGGASSFSFANFPQSPIKFNPKNLPPKFPVRMEWTPYKFTYKKYGKYYDYFLIRARSPRKDLFKNSRGKVKLILKRNNFYLYEKVK